jgi:predicted metal-binding membrane protein
MVVVAQVARIRVSRTTAALIAAIAVAWFLCAWMEVTGVAGALHHHALYHSGIPLWQAGLLLSGAWQVMTAAMMLPSSLPLMVLFGRAGAAAPRRASAFALFIAGYFLVWTAFAVSAFTFDMGVHWLAHSWTWLFEHDQVIPAATLALAAVYQVTPLKDACLRSCRNPAIYLLRNYRRGRFGGLRLGVKHGVFCLGCCWALMLLMFAVGVAHLAWMGALAVVMVVEKTLPGGNALTRPLAVVLAGLAVVALLAPGSIPGL